MEVVSGVAREAALVDRDDLSSGKRRYSICDLSFALALLFRAARSLSAEPSQSSRARRSKIFCPQAGNRLGGEADRLGGPQNPSRASSFGQLMESGVGGEQVLETSGRRDRAVVDKYDEVGLFDGREPVRDHQDRFAT